MFQVLLLLVLITFTTSQTTKSPIIISGCERSIDLRTQLVFITTKLTLENTGKDVLTKFLIVHDPDIPGTPIHVTVLANEVKLSLAPTTVANSKESYIATLNVPLEPGKNTQILVKDVYIKAQLPYPQSTQQRDRQLYRYIGNLYYYSAYPVSSQVTNVVYGYDIPDNYTKTPHKVQTAKHTVLYGTFLDIAPFSSEELMIHGENNSPFMSVTRLERSIEVSHWGNIAIEENIDLLHTGPKLKGPFSRYDYQRDGGSKYAVKSYTTLLPAAAYNIYYRDSNGNISTSNVRSRNDYVHVDLRPRFPLFGGWKSSYTLGYNVPSYQYLYKKSSSEFVLNLRLLDHVHNSMLVEELETSIVLPVGVSNVKVTTPYPVERLPNGVTYKYLDNLGRIVIRLKKNSLIELHIQDIQISYTWQPLLLLHEPILLAVALYALFIIVIVYVRLDFSIHKPEPSKKD